MVHSWLPDPDGVRHLCIKTSGIFRQLKPGVGLDGYDDEGDVSVAPSKTLNAAGAGVGTVNELCVRHLSVVLDIPRNDAASEWLRRNGHGDPHPPNGPKTFLGTKHMSVEYQPDPELAPGRETRPYASNADISRADEAAAWLGLIPNDKRIIRRCVCMAVRLDVHTGKAKHSWNAIGRDVGADAAAVGPWIKQGIGIIADALKAKLNALVRKPTSQENAMDLNKPIHPDTMLTRKEVSEAIKHYFDLNISYATLSTLAFKGIGPKFRKITGPCLYRWGDVSDWIIEQSKPRYSTRQLAMA